MVNDLTWVQVFFKEILGKRSSKKGAEYHIKWEDYEETTWEPSKNIPSSIREYYEETGNGKLPTPKVKESKKQGSTIQYELVWSNDSSLPEFDPAKHILLEPAESPLTKEKRSCNTRKDRDRRQNRHTCGIFIGSVLQLIF